MCVLRNVYYLNSCRQRDAENTGRDLDSVKNYLF